MTKQTATQDNAGLVEAMARAFYDAEDPSSGDSIATTIHLTEHIPPHGTIAEQLEQVMDTCRSAATAALAVVQPMMDEMREERDVALTRFYCADRLGCARLCDEVLDRSGALLGRIRHRALTKGSSDIRPPADRGVG